MHVLLAKSITTNFQNTATKVVNTKLYPTRNSFCRQNVLTVRHLKSQTVEPPQCKPIAYKDVQLGKFTHSFVNLQNNLLCFIGIPKEIFKNERRVAIVPQTVSTFTKKGIQVLVEENAGVEAKFSNSDYEACGAKVVNRDKLFSQSNIILKVRQPALDTELNLLRNESTLISMMFPAQNKELVDSLAKKSMNVFAMDCIPRISRAQTFDVLSSMANIAG